MDTLKSGWTLMFITQRYTRRREPFMPIYWGRFLRKVRGNQSKRQL